QRTDQQRHANIELQQTAQHRPGSTGGHRSEDGDRQHKEGRAWQEDADERGNQPAGNELTLAADVEQAGAEGQHHRQGHADDERGPRKRCHQIGEAAAAEGALDEPFDRVAETGPDQLHQHQQHDGDPEHDRQPRHDLAPKDSVAQLHAATAEPWPRWEVIRLPSRSRVASLPGTSPAKRPSYMTRMRSESAITSSSSVETSSTAWPASRMRISSPWMKSIAPISTPQVGFSAMMSGVARVISRPTTSFCLLPPDMVEASADGPATRMSKRRMMSRANSAMAPRRRNGPLAKPPRSSRPALAFSLTVAASASPMRCRSSGM